MNKRPIMPEDLYHYRSISQPVIHPNGQVAYVEQTIDRQKNEYNTRIRGISLDGSNDVELTHGTKDTAPSWTPDGTRLAFLRLEEGGKGLWILASGEDEPVNLIPPERKILDYAWSPDCQYIAFTSKVQIKDAEGKDEPENEKAPELRGRVYERTTPKAEGSGWWDGLNSHLFVYEVGSGEITSVITGTWNVSGPIWSPDSQSLAFISKQVEDKESDADLLYFTDVYTIRPGVSDPSKVTDSSLLVSQFSYSPDGQMFNLIASDREFGSGSHNRLYAVPVQGGIPKRVTSKLDMQLGNAALGDMKAAGPSPAPVWDANHPERGMFVLGTHDGSVDVYRIHENGDYQPVTGKGEKDVYQYTLSPDGSTLVIAALTADHLRSCIAWILRLAKWTGSPEETTNG